MKLKFNHRLNICTALDELIEEILVLPLFDCCQSLDLPMSTFIDLSIDPKIAYLSFQVIRMVTTRLKTNPYNVVGADTEPNEMTLGQKLAMKHTISDPPKNRASTTNRQSHEIKWPP